MAEQPIIPSTITVHLGTPQSDAPNVTVPFPDYIKNVASSEIYPTWPESALRANIYAQISFALNRVYTEYYRSQGYDFDITNATAFDQSYVPNRDIFDNISDIVDDIFNDYLRRPGSVEPLFAQYCNGTTVTCDGLSQWGTVALANEGLGAYDILATFYGDDLEIVENAPVGINSPSYPGLPLQIGEAGNDVKLKQVQLNRISRNYPSIPKIYPVDGVFGQETDDAVRAFQRIFGLTEDGIIGKATWYRIAFIYGAVKRLSELNSEGITFEEVAQQYPGVLQQGDAGSYVQVVQYYLAIISIYYDEVPTVAVTGQFDEQTVQGVEAFQRVYGLPITGIIDRATWQDMVRAYRGIIADNAYLEGGVALFPGSVLRLGSRSDDVLLMQQYLNEIGRTYPDIPVVAETGTFGNQTQAAVRAFQTRFGLPATGIIDAVTWAEIADLYSDLTLGFNKQPTQYVGRVLTEQ